MNNDTIISEDDATARVYCDAWAFLREAEACAEEGRDPAAHSLARAAVLHAAVAARRFLEKVVAQVSMDPNAANAAVARVAKDVLGNKRLADEWRALSRAREAILELNASADAQDRLRASQGFLDEIGKRMLALALEHCRENLHDKRLAKASDALSELQSRLGRNTLDSGSLAKKWFERATGLPDPGAGGEPSVRDFQQIVLKARGESAAGGPQDITVEEARLACGAVRSMIASVCGAANRKVPQWVREIHGRVL